MVNYLSTGGRVAQLVEQCPFKAWVAGSSPAALTKISRCLEDFGRVQPCVEIDAIGATNVRVPRILDANSRKGRQSDDSAGGHQSLTQT
jgi:hypothetical protein